MKKILHWVTLCISSFFISVGYAGQDPIGWSLEGSFPAHLAPNLTYTVKYHFINNLPFTMVTPLIIVTKRSPNGEFFIQDGCTNKKLASKQICTVIITHIPLAAGVKFISLQMNYGSNKVNLPTLRAIADSAAAQVQGSTPNSLPPVTRPGTTYPVTFKFINNNPQPIAILRVTPRGFTPTSNTCSGQIEANSFCIVTGTFTAPNTADEKVLSVHLRHVGGEVELTTHTRANTTLTQSDRIITYVNYCTQNIWIGFNASAVPNTSPNCTNCTESGGVCATNNICFYSIPSLATYELGTTSPSNTTSMTITTPAVLQNNQIWDTQIFARTGCSTSPSPTGSCTTGYCGGDGTGACDISGSGLSINSYPFTLSELTLNSGSASQSDFYDVSLFNGFNLPISIAPTTTPVSPTDSYTCGTAGSVTTIGTGSNTLGACSWQFSPPLPEYNAVTPGGIACTSNSNCATGQICGLSVLPNSTNYGFTCGTQIGYITAYRICATDSTFSDANINCQAPVTGGTFGQLVQCQAPFNPDCYSTNPPSTCCGCVDWFLTALTGVTVPQNVSTTCNGSNPVWLGSNSASNPPASPTLSQSPGYAASLWVKQACPSAYSFPNDDGSSTFTCSAYSGGFNTVDYTVTFCPNNAPA